jgi:N6-adenosine-specific RNA methylase IME4
MTNALAKLGKAHTLLAEARSLPQVLKVRDLAEAAKTYARSAHLGREAQNYAGEIALAASIKAGEILEKLEKSDGGRPDKKTQVTVIRVSEYAEVLKETGTSRPTAIRWQRLADKSLVPDSLVAAYVESCKASGEVTMAGLLREAIHRQRASLKAEPPPMPLGVYRVLYADPPWDYGNPIAQGYGAAENHYAPMTLEEICAMKLPEIAENAVLFLWTTMPFLFKSREVLEAWQFEYRSNFVWNKGRHNFGYYNSPQHEHLLVGTRGRCRPDFKEIPSVQTIKRTVHSRKPEQFREIIDKLYPKGRRIELFARGKAPEGWDVFGNQAIPRSGGLPSNRGEAA